MKRDTRSYRRICSGCRSRRKSAHRPCKQLILLLFLRFPWSVDTPARKPDAQRLKLSVTSTNEHPILHLPAPRSAWDPPSLIRRKRSSTPLNRNPPTPAEPGLASHCAPEHFS